MVLASSILALVVSTQPGTLAVPLTGGDRVEWRRGESPTMLALPLAGEGWLALAGRLTGSPHNARELQQTNETATRPLRGVRVRVPVVLLRPDLKVVVLRALFPEDRRVSGGYLHVLRAPWGGDGESWWELAEWFCGSGELYPALRQANPELGLFPPRGTRVLIPEATLLGAFASLKVEVSSPTPTIQATAPPRPSPTARQVPITPTATPPLEVPSTPVAVTPGTRKPEPSPTAVEAARVTAVPTPPQVSEKQESTAGSSPLEYRGDDAVYQLRAGEALYSSVVVRFTGQLHAVDVNATAAELARRSGISDVTQIPVGYPIRIPLDLLLPEFLPPGHPGRIAWEKERGEIQAIKRAIRAANLDGIHVILDAGHGGGDTGAVVDELWESTYAYDVMSRLQRVLRSDSRATVWATVRDNDARGSPPNLDELPHHRHQSLLVDPAYDLADSSTGVHLRWVLANSILDRLHKQKVNPEQVAFISIHADSLHPAVRGLMVYVPSRALRVSRGPALGGLFPCREIASYKPPRFSPAFGARSEALSTQLGEAIVAAATRWVVPVHPYQPVRGSVRRGGGRWVPAVLKYSRVPTSVLVEICNLNNEEDRAQLRTAAFREKLAHAIAAGLAEAFSR